MIIIHSTERCVVLKNQTDLPDLRIKNRVSKLTEAKNNKKQFSVRLGIDRIIIIQYTNKKVIENREQINIR